MIVEGKIVNHDSEIYGQIQLNEQTGIIENVGENLGAPDIKTTGLIFPGFIDLHVHTRVDASGKELYKEDLETATAAAIRGGVTHVADMPNNPVPPIDDDSYKKKKELFAASPIDVTLYAGIGPETEPLSARAPYKVFLARPPVGELFLVSKQAVETAMEKYRGQFVSFHAEDAEILQQNESAVSHESRRPVSAEQAAIDFVISLTEKYQLHSKICHLSTTAGLEAIKTAKARGLDITVEAAPHHLYFDETMLTEQNRKWLQMNPPLRTREDRLALIAGLKNGDIDFLATDHAPHSPEEKQKGMSGVPHLDTYGPFITWLMGEHGFTVRDIARVCSFNPGKFVNEFNQYKFGKIEPRYAGSLTIINPATSITINKKDLKTKCAWSPFENLTFPGRVTHTIVRGKVYAQ